jgi:hypothetical protein
MLNEGGFTEVAIRRGLSVDGLLETELLDDHTRTKVKVIADDIDELLVRLLACTVGIDENRERLCDTDGVRKLHQGATSQASGQERLGCKIYE